MGSDILIIILAVFATYRLSTDLAWERGPYDVYAKLRGAVQTRYGADDWRSEGVTCPICWSFWIGLLISLATLLFAMVSAWLWPVWWLGISGAAAWFARGHNP